MAAAVGGAMLLAATGMAQYPGVIAKKEKATPELRSVAVLEWTGEPGKPSASRLVPVAVYDGAQLNDGTLYLNRPEPLALGGGVEYELQTAGKPVGIFDVYGAGEIKGSWQGFGAWKPLSAADTVKASNSFNVSQMYGADIPDEDEKPVLKRKHPKGTDGDDAPQGGSGSGTGASAGGGSGDGKSSASSDLDRPQLKRKSESDAGSAGASQGVADPDRPTIRRKHTSDDSETVGGGNGAPDPDRPRLKRGKPDSLATTESPRLAGYPPSMQQAVAVSDAGNRKEHPWKYTWANPDDETKMKQALEAMARTALGLDAPPAPAKVRTRTGTKSAPAKKVSMLHPDGPEPVALADEQFRVFELAYGATATMVLTASSPLPPPTNPGDDPGAPPGIQRGKPAHGSNAPDVKQTVPTKPAAQKFVTIIAQPDLYGGVQVLYKSVADSAHLDETPRMTLVDAVDALGDNRGELLFELRGDQQRQFAMYRVLRGSAEQLFATVALP